ncbi:MAG TPA: penicillin-binding protein activator, partial [Steroidobacteraceae bacterium]|nr:penicillin-binding protein activator [Steroidobacteraceae bacterium]
MQSSLPPYRLFRLLGAALLFAALSACAHFPPARFPGATPGAATQAPAGERRAEAIALENAARQAPPGAQAQLELRAARAWLQAGRAGEAQRVLGALSTGLTPVQNIERRVLDADIELASGRAQQAWLKMSAIPEPTGTPLAPQYFDSRMRIALAAARPVEGVRAEMDAERITADGAARSVLRSELLAQLRAARETGVKLEPEASHD